MCHAINQYAKTNNKYIKDYDKNKESSYLKYLDVNNLYGWAISQKLLGNNFKWIEDTSQFNEDFINSCIEESDEGYFLEADVQNTEKLHELRNDLPFLPERMTFEKVEKFVANLHDKSEYVTHIRNLKQALSHGLVLTKFNQNTWLKSYTDMNTKLREKPENNFEKDFFKMMNNIVFEKTVENVRKHRDIKFLTTERRRNYLASEPDYYIKKFFTENLLAIEIRKTQI